MVRRIVARREYTLDICTRVLYACFRRLRLLYALFLWRSSVSFCNFHASFGICHLPVSKLKNVRLLRMTADDCIRLHERESRNADRKIAATPGFPFIKARVPSRRIFSPKLT